MFSDLLPRKRRRARRPSCAFLRASWFRIVTVVRHWWECLEQQQPLLGCEGFFQAHSYAHRALKWLSEHRNTRTAPRRLCQHSPFPAGHTKSRDSQGAALLALHISSITDTGKLSENTEHFPHRPLVLSYK